MTVPKVRNPSENIKYSVRGLKFDKSLISAYSTPKFPQAFKHCVQGCPPVSEDSPIGAIVLCLAENGEKTRVQ